MMTFAYKFIYLSFQFKRTWFYGPTPPYGQKSANQNRVLWAKESYTAGGFYMPNNSATKIIRSRLT